jgi:hypothetical protein
VPQTDFVTALGRLLRDGVARDAYRADPARTIERLELAEAERALLLNLDADDLEFQAEVLLRKRFEAISRVIPQTLANLGEDAWPAFVKYARNFWPVCQKMAAQDAGGFFEHLRTHRPAVICGREANRIRFALGHRRIEAHLRDMHVRGRVRKCLQLFFRWRSGWSEHAFYLAF